jgi:TetR/AcrR family transcriptional repressor of mexJK operon
VPIPPRLGRPKDTAKRDAIMVAARTLCQGQPFDAVTMEAVAAAAGVSKMTVYNHFTDKESLFEAIVRSVSDEMLRELPAPEESIGSLRDQLIVTGTQFLSVILGPELLAMCHALPVALRTNRALARRFYEAGPGRVRSAVGAVLAAEARRGTLIIDDPDWAAQDLLCLWEGSEQSHYAYGLIDLPTKEQIAERARRGTDTFLRAYGVPRSS